TGANLFGGYGWGRRACDRKRYGKRRALTRAAFDLKPSLMAIDDVLHNGKAETCASLLAAALHVDAIETLGQAWDRIGRNAFAVVADARSDRSMTSSAGGGVHERESHPHMAAVFSVLDRVVNEILKQLDQLITLARNWGKIGACGNLDRDAF